MMKTGCTGTESPKNGTGGLRRVVLALAVLLLTCVLMAGAVSADDLSTYWSNHENVAWGSDGTLFEVSGDATLVANIPAALVGSNTTIIKITGDSVTLDGNGHSIDGNGASTQSTQYGVYAGDAKDLTIKNLTVTGTFGSESYSSDVGGIFVTNTNAGRGGTITIENCDVSATLTTSASKKAYGISVMANSTAITISSCEVSGKFSGYQVYGIQALNRLGGTEDAPNTVLVKDCILSGTLTASNSHNAQGICASSKYDPTYGRGPDAGPIDVTIQNCRITSSAELSGNICHGIYGRAYNGKLTITSCTVDSSAEFNAKATTYGGAISVSDDGDAEISVTSCDAQNTNALNGISIVQGDTNTNPGGVVEDGVGTVQSSSLSLTENTLAGKTNCISVYVGSKAEINGLTSLTLSGNTYGVGKQIAFGGEFYTQHPETLTVKDGSGNVMLIPGLSQKGVTWTGDDESGYTLTIDEAGSYKLMDAFATTGSGIQITAGGVTLDGDGKKITTIEPLKGYILKVAVANTDGAAGVTLQKLNISGDEASGTGNYGGVTVYAGKGKTSVPVTLKGSTVDMSKVTTESGMNPAVYFVNAPGSQITDNEITAGNTKADGSSTPRAIVVADGSDISISKNEITMGETKEGVVSHAIQFQGPPTGVTISDNKITATSENSLNRAVSLTTTGAEGESYVITGNTLTGNTFNAAVHVIIPSTIKEGASFNLEIDGNTFTNTDNGVMIADYGTNGITLTGKINTDDFPGKTAETIISAEEGVVTLSDTFKWTHDPEPSYSSSSGNMNNAYRVLFNDGSTTLSVQTDLSSGDKLTKPETPVKDGYTFAGWYKDSACTQGWDFETGISGDMTLYAKWTAAGSSGETEATATPTKTQTAVTTPQPTKTQSTTATTSAPEATTAAGVSPTLTQAPAPVAGALFGLLAAGVLLRRRFQ